MFPRHRCVEGNKPTLHYDELCPQSRSCYMLAKVMDIDMDLVPLERTESIKKSNYSGQLLKLIDGQYTLNNGNTIMIYLCDKYTQGFQPNLCPRDYLARLGILHILFNESCILQQHYEQLVSEIIRKQYSNVDINYHRAKVIKTYNALNGKLQCQSSMSGNCFTIADLAIITTISCLELIFPITKEQWPNLYRWFKDLKAMECYKYNALGLQKLLKYLHSEGKFPLPVSRNAMTIVKNKTNCRPSKQMSENKPECPSNQSNLTDSAIFVVSKDCPANLSFIQVYRLDDMPSHCRPSNAMDDVELVGFAPCICIESSDDSCDKCATTPSDRKVDADGNQQCAGGSECKCDKCKCSTVQEDNLKSCNSNNTDSGKDNRIPNKKWCCEECKRKLCVAPSETGPEELICCYMEKQQQPVTDNEKPKCCCNEEISEKRTTKAKITNISSKNLRKDMFRKKVEDKANLNMPISRIAGRDMIRKKDEFSANKTATISRISGKIMSRKKDESEANKNMPVTKNVSGRDMHRKKDENTVNKNISVFRTLGKDLSRKRDENEASKNMPPVCKIAAKDMIRKREELIAYQNTSISRISRNDICRKKDENEANKNTPIFRISGKDMNRTRQKSLMSRYSSKPWEENVAEKIFLYSMADSRGTSRDDNQKYRKEKQRSRSEGLVRCSCSCKTDDREKTEVQAHQNPRLNEGIHKEKTDDSDANDIVDCECQKSAIDDSCKCDEHHDEIEYDADSKSEEDPIHDEEKDERCGEEKHETQETIGNVIRRLSDQYASVSLAKRKSTNVNAKGDKKLLSKDSMIIETRPRFSKHARPNLQTQLPATTSLNADISTTENPLLSKSHKRVQSESGVKLKATTSRNGSSSVVEYSSSLFRGIFCESNKRQTKNMDASLKKNKDDTESEAYPQLFPRIRTFKYSNVLSYRLKNINFVKRSGSEIEKKKHPKATSERSELPCVEILQETIPTSYDC